MTRFYLELQAPTEGALRAVLIDLDEAWTSVSVAGQLGFEVRGWTDHRAAQELAAELGHCGYIARVERETAR